MVEVRTVPEIRRGGFILRQGGEDSEALRLSEALMKVVVIEGGVAMTVMVEVARSRGGRRGSGVGIVVVVGFNG